MLGPHVYPGTVAETLKPLHCGSEWAIFVPPEILPKDRDNCMVGEESLYTRPP